MDTRRMLTRAAPWCLTLVLAMGPGCAGYSIQKNGTGSGYDVYTPEPYLLRKPITSMSGGGEITGFNFEVVWLPNYSKRYRVRSWTGFGKSEFTFEFAEGWKLTKIVDKADNSEVLDKLVDLTKGVLANVTQSAPEPKPGKLDLAASSSIPVLYKIEFDDCTGQPTGLRQICANWCADSEAASRSANSISSGRIQAPPPAPK